jgi:hypothetical protein
MVRSVEDLLVVLWVLTALVLAASFAGFTNAGSWLVYLAVFDLICAIAAFVAAGVTFGRGWLNPSGLTVRDAVPLVVSIALTAAIISHTGTVGSVGGMSGDDRHCTMTFDHGARTEILDGSACRAAYMTLGRDFLGAVLTGLALAWVYSRLTRRQRSETAGHAAG